MPAPSNRPEIAPLEILTPRLRLAPFDIERDWHDIARIGGDPRVARMTSEHISPWPEADVRAFLAASQWRGRLGFRLGLWFQGDLIGAVGIWDDPVEVGYFLDPAFWGQGLATEAMSAFLPQSGQKRFLSQQRERRQTPDAFLKASGKRERYRRIS